MGGGLAYGRQILVWGNKSAGKSSLCLQIEAEAQKKGKTAAWVDAEQSFDPIWAQRLGVNTDELVISKSKTVEGMAQDVIALIQAGVDVIVIDSISALLSSAFFGKKDEELKDLNDTKQIGSLSRDLANAVNMINYVNEKTMIIFISQVRNKISAVGAFPKPMGGFAMEFFSSTIIKLWASPRADEQIKGEIVVGDRVIQTNVGRPVDWLVEFNKTSSPGKSGKYDFFYEGESVGVDTHGEVLDLAAELGIINKGGAWYTFHNGDKIQGRDRAVLNLKQQPDLYAEVLGRVNESVR